jgi:polysaccharide export outer membrane protein
MKIRIRSFVLMVLLVSFGGYAAASAKESTAALNAKYAASTANAPATEAGPVKNAPATPEPAMTVNGAGYKIIPGDVLQIDVWKEDGLNQEVLVLPDGMITFPLAGSFSVLNMSPEEVQATLKDKLKQYIPDATVTVSVKAALGHTVSVIGQVTKPGEFIMSHGLTVMQALSQAGGLTPYADEGSVIVLRRTGDGKETSIPVPYDDISRGRELDQDLVLNPGDVVVVPTTSLF